MRREGFLGGRWSEILLVVSIAISGRNLDREQGELCLAAGKKVSRSRNHKK